MSRDFTYNNFSSVDSLIIVSISFFLLHLQDYLSVMVYSGDLYNLLESSDVVGNIRFSHPTLYVFPGGQGDAALFGINGFNMLGTYYSIEQYFLTDIH